MRRYLSLITEHPDESRVGQVECREKPLVSVEKGEESVVNFVDLDKETQEVVGRSEEKHVGLGYHDFENQTAYENPMRFKEVVQQKLTEIDAGYLHKAGLDDVVDTGRNQDTEP